MAEDNVELRYVEGYGDAGKPLERITKSLQLQELQKKIKEDEVELNRDLSRVQEQMMDLQNRLKACNDNYSEEKHKLDQQRAQRRVALDGDQKKRIMEVTKEQVEDFMCRRPRREDDQMTVDVHFLSGTETTGFNLHIHGEGAGSRDAKFIVQLNQKVHSLATQAAKYWGLDAEKVFFLDRDGRIVPDNMSLSDIILPPAASSSTNLPSSDQNGMPGDAAEDALGESQEKDMWMVKGRNYSLTLVRASTVLSKEDLNRPKGEKWEDFTFNEMALNRELENTRKQRGDLDAESKAISMDLIPSLNDLMQQGQERKRRKTAETRCRICEFMIFAITEILFLAALAASSSQNMSLHLLATNVGREFTTFSLDEDTSTFLASVADVTFTDISTPAQYQQWISGPLMRGLAGLTLADQNLFVLQALAQRYEAVANTVPTGVQFCGMQLATNSTNSSSQGKITTTGSKGATTSEVKTTTELQTTKKRLRRLETVTTEKTTTTDKAATTTKETTTTGKDTTTTDKGITTTDKGTTTTDKGTTTTDKGTTTTTKLASPMILGTSANSNTSHNTSNQSSILGCIPETLQSCPSSRAVSILFAGLQTGSQVPSCQPLYTPPAGQGLPSATSSFSMIIGKVHVYGGGTQYQLAYSNGSQALNSSIYTFLGSSPTNFQFVGVAQMISVFVYSPTMNSFIICKLLVEQTFSGRLLPSTTYEILNLEEENSQLKSALLALSMLFSILLVVAEIRRILGWPKQLTFEDERSRLSCWTFLLVLLPLLILLILALTSQRDGMMTQILQLQGPRTPTISMAALDAMVNRQNLNTFIYIVKIATLFVFNILICKYLLLHFPQLIFMTAMVSKIIMPLLTAIMFLVVSVACLSVVLYAMYGSSELSFKSAAQITLSAVTFLRGSIPDWINLYKRQTTFFPIVIGVAFIIIRLAIASLPLAIMLSHKKEMDLYQNYSYHPSWASERSKGNMDPSNSNPAMIGYDFSNPKEPKQVQAAG